MTKFGKHPDKDTVDLAAEAAMAALADGGVTMKDMGVLAAGNLMGAARRHRPAAAEADRPDRHPRLQRGQRLRHRRHRAAHGDHGREGRRVRHGPRRRRREAGRRRPPRRRRHAARPTTNVCEPKGRYGAVAPVDGRIGTETMPGVFAQVGMEYVHEQPYGGADLRAVRPHQREEPRPLDAEPAGRLHEEDDPRGDHGRRHDRLPEHPADVLGQLRRRRRRGGGVAARS